MRQISVFVENKPGRLAEMTGYLAENNINIHAISIADTPEFGILRLIVSDPDGAAETLRSRGLMVRATDVFAVVLDDKPGCLHKILSELDAHDISVEYMYPFTSRCGEHDSVIILRISNQHEAWERLKQCDIRLVENL